MKHLIGISLVLGFVFFGYPANFVCLILLTTYLLFFIVRAIVRG